ncbi:DUF4303 domain-containing protein [Vibrio fluvialis]|nr:DUF4303 domain-containing protein [Vibrio fluvialis]MBY7942437.1 DUF4303 domain-containing protein [Vibrio fluvialis]MBY8169449.1 DUF4303 domain-containing protein [Vibrio fluvialis]
MNWDNFEEKCFKATVEVLSKLISEHKNEKIYAFALYTDGGAMTVSVSANSEERLNLILDEDSDKSKENQNYYKWATSEWAYESYDDYLYCELCKELRHSSDRENFFNFRNSLITSMTNVLVRVRKEMLNDALASITMFVSVTDDDDSEYIENESSEKINEIALHENFLNRYDN